MDEQKMILEKRIEKTMKALEKNKMKPFMQKTASRHWSWSRSFCSRDRRWRAAAR